MSSCEGACNKTIIRPMYSQDMINIDPGLEAKLFQILRDTFNVTGTQALNQQFLDQLLKERNMTREDFLASIDETTTKFITQPINNGGDGESDVSLGVIIPIVLIAAFLVCVASCLYWHSWRDKNRRSNHSHSVDRSVNTSFERFSRSLGKTPTRVDYVRGSTRSTTPLSVRDKVNVVPLTDSNPGQFKFYWDKDNWKLCPPDDSMPTGGLTGSRSSLLRQHLSPIDEMESPAFYAEQATNYDVEAQPPFSPYHLTWPTPKAPPPSYEESEMSSPDKSQRIMISNNTTGTNNTVYTGYSKENTTGNTCSGYTGYSIKDNMTDNTCSGCTGYSKDNTTNNTCSGYSKGRNSPFYPNNNTPITDIEFASENDSLPPKMVLMMNSNHTSNPNSRFTSYPSTPHSSLESLTESHVDTVEEVSYRNQNSHDHFDSGRIYNRHSQHGQHNVETDRNRNSLYSNTNAGSQYSNNYTTTYQEDYSTGIPSLPSSILHYHQKMGGARVVMSGKVPLFSPHAFHSSQASSLESSDTNYTDNTSMLPCVGSSITSGNPTGLGLSMLQNTNMHNSVVQQNATENSQNISPEDLSKIVDELSSIRPGSNEPPSVNHGVINSMIGFEGAVGHSYVADIYPPQQGQLEGKVNQNITELFRSWSVTAELDYSSVSSKGGGTSMQTPLNEGSFSWDTYPLKKDAVKNNSNIVTDVNHNVVSINNLPQPGRNIQFSVPVLVDKTYWV